MAGSNKDTHWWKHKYDCLSKDHKEYIGEYRVWNSMKARCQKPSNSMYGMYGGRGIKVCERWLGEKGFINFYNDMGKRPSDSSGRSYQIDRIDNDGDYCPENCKWVPTSENAHNKRNNIYVVIYGDKYCVSEACRMFGINRTTVTEAIRLRGKSADDAFADAIERRK